MWIQIVLFAAAFVLIPLLDYLYLGKLMYGFYLNELGSLARMQDGRFQPMLLPAAGVYALLALGVVCFVLSWVESWSQALVWGGVLGLIIYGVYDLTNLSTLQGYSWKMTIADMAWGTVLCGFVSVLTFFLRQRLA